MLKFGFRAGGPRAMQFIAFDCVWDAVEPDLIKRTDLRLRADLLLAMQNYVDATPLDRFKLARQLEISASRLKHLRQGIITQFELSDLIALCVKAGLKVNISTEPAQPVSQPGISE